MKKILPIILALFIIFLIPNFASAEGLIYSFDEQSPCTGYIYTGDSRIRRLNLTVRMDKLENTWVVCKSGMGYSWFVNEGLPQINDIMKNQTEIDNWVIVSAWGVNDLWNSDTYIRKYRKLLKNEWKGCNLYLMSVNPVNGSMTAKYSSIPYFNSKIKAFTEEKKSIKYIDTYSVMKRQGFRTIDGLHYTESTNRLIYKTVRDSLNKDNASLTYKKIVMYIGNQSEIEVCDYEGELEWDTEDRVVAYIKKIKGKNGHKAVIRAGVPGNTVITAKSDGICLKCDIVVLSVPECIRMFKVGHLKQGV